MCQYSTASERERHWISCKELKAISELDSAKYSNMSHLIYPAAVIRWFSKRKPFKEQSCQLHPDACMFCAEECETKRLPNALNFWVV